MKTIQAYEFKDLDSKHQEKVRNKFVDSEIESQLDMLREQIELGQLTEEKYWKIIGCSKSYGEQTPWFVASVYYEHNKQSVDEHIEEMLSETLFNKFGEVFA